MITFERLPNLKAILQSILNIKNKKVIGRMESNKIDDMLVHLILSLI